MNKFSIKRLLAVLTLTICMLFPVACANDVDEGGKWWTTTGELVKDEEGNVVFDNVEIKLSTVVAGEDKEAFNTIVNQFNRLYDGKITIVPTNISSESFEDYVTKQISQNFNAPDFMMSHQKAHKNFAVNKMIQPFDETMEATGIDIDPSEFAEGLAKYSSLGYKDTTYSFPIDAQSSVVFYNKKLLAKYSDTVPTSRAELLAVCEAFKADTSNAKAPIAWASAEKHFINYVFPTAILQNGGRFFKEDDYMVDWYDNTANRASFTNAIKSFRDLMDAGYAVYNEAESEILRDFLAGERLFYFSTPWTMNDLVDNYARQLGVSETVLIQEYMGGASTSGWFALDANNVDKNSVFGDAHFFVMSKTVSDINKKAGILEFIRWFTHDVEVGRDWAKAGHISATTSVRASEEYVSDIYVDEFISKFYGDIDNFRCIGSTPYYDPILTNLDGLFPDTVGKKNQTTAADESALKKRQDTINGLISFF